MSPGASGAAEELRRGQCDQHQGSRPGRLLERLTSREAETAAFPGNVCLSFTSSRLFLSLRKGVIRVMNQTQGLCLCKRDQRLISAGAGSRCPPGSNGEMWLFLAQVGCCPELPGGLGPPHLRASGTHCELPVPWAEGLIQERELCRRKCSKIL